MSGVLKECHDRLRDCDGITLGVPVCRDILILPATVVVTPLMDEDGHPAVAQDCPSWISCAA